MKSPSDIRRESRTLDFQPGQSPSAYASREVGNLVPRPLEIGARTSRTGPAQALNQNVPGPRKLVQVPRPLYEYNSYEYGVSLFEHLRARALLIAGAHPDANRDGSADLVRMTHYRSLFSLVNQVMLRESGDEPLLVIHSRAFGYRPDLPPPALAAPPPSIASITSFSTLKGRPTCRYCSA